MHPELEPVTKTLVESAEYCLMVQLIMETRPWLSPPASRERPFEVFTSQQLESRFDEGKMVIKPFCSESELYLVCW